MSQSTEKKKSLPLHFQILIAMLVGTAIGIAVNPGDVSLTRSVTALLSREGDTIQLRERDSESNDAVYTETFASAAVFADSYPKLAEALGDSDTREIEVTNARARFTYGMISPIGKGDKLIILFFPTIFYEQWVGPSVY